MFKPNFGQTTATPAFGAFTGAANANPFGPTSVFGKTTTTGFAPPAFGATSSTGLFSNTLSSTPGLFGSSTTASTFGQTPAQTFVVYVVMSQPTTNLFDSQQIAGTSLFGSGSTSAFGANKPPFGSAFGTGPSTSLFGSQQPTQTATPLFGQTTPATGTGLFGSGTGTFGASNQQTGTVIKFNPITGTDNAIKNGVAQTVSTRHFCITCMKEYGNKSLEELRYEDYLANRKGPQQSNLFGAPAQQPSLFGAATSGGNLFGTPQTTTSTTLIGQPSTSLGGFGTSSSSVFGSTPAATNSLFGGKPSGFGTTTTTTPAFGFGQTTSNSLFGNTQSKAFGTTPQIGMFVQPAAQPNPRFGTTTTTTPAFGFGQTTSNSLFGNTQSKAFGTTPQTGMFGQPAAQPTPGFGTNTGVTGFGKQQNQSIGLFGNKPATFNIGTTTSSGFTFGSNTTTSTGFFGAKPATSAFGTTQASGFGTGFGNTNTFGTSTATSTSMFKPPTTNFSFVNMQNTGTLGSNTQTLRRSNLMIRTPTETVLRDTGDNPVSASENNPKEIAVLETILRRMAKMETRLGNTIKESYDKFRKELTEAKEDWKKEEMALKKEIAELREELGKQKAQGDKEQREEKKNIIITGKPLTNNELELRKEVGNFILEELEVRVLIDDAHKMGHKTGLVKLLSKGDRQEIVKYKHKLRHSKEKIFISDDVSVEDMKIRKLIRGRAKLQRQEGKKVKFGRGKIQINDEWFLLRRGGENEGSKRKKRNRVWKICVRIDLFIKKKNQKYVSKNQ